MVFIVPIENRRGKLFRHCLFLCTATQFLSLSVFKSSLSPDQRQSLQGTDFWCPGGFATDRSQPLKFSSVPIVSGLANPQPSPSSWTLQSTNIPSNSSVLCSLFINNSDVLSWNEWKCQRLFVLVSFHCVCSVSVAVCWLPRIWTGEAMDWLGAWMDSLGGCGTGLRGQ